MGHESHSSSAGAAINSKLACTPPLRQFVDRILNMSDEVFSLAQRLDEHADFVKGPVPRTDEIEDLSVSSPDGVLGSIDLALDRLERAIGEATYAAGRNMGLA